MEASSNEGQRISRRRYLKFVGATAAAVALGALGGYLYWDRFLKTSKPPITATTSTSPVPIPSPIPVKREYDVWTYYLPGLAIPGVDPGGLNLKYATVEPIYGLRQDQLTMMIDIKYALENGINTFIIPSAFPDTPWERRFKGVFLRASVPLFRINHSLMFNPAPYLEKELGPPPYPLETGIEKTIKEFFNAQFSDERYKRVNGKPLVTFFYANQIAYHINFGGLDRLEKVVDILRSSASEDVFLVGDVMVELEMIRNDPRIIGDPTFYERQIRPFDAITGYYLWRAGEGWLLKDSTPYVVKPFKTMIEGYKLASEFWGEKAHKYGVKFIPPIAPTGVSNQRRFDAGIDDWLVNRHEGVTYDTSREMAEVVKPYVDPNLKAVVIGAFNELTEGAAVVPSKQFGFGPIHAVRDAYAIKPVEGWPPDYYPDNI